MIDKVTPPGPLFVQSFPAGISTEEKRTQSMEKVSLMSGKWSHLVHFNYEVEPSTLEPYLPAGAEIDLFNGKTWLSMVGMTFEDLTILGVEDPLHTKFEQ